MKDTIEHDDRHTAGSYRGVYVPTPEQIATECERIRSEWDAERLRKAKQK